MEAMGMLRAPSCRSEIRSVAFDWPRLSSRQSLLADAGHDGSPQSGVWCERQPGLAGFDAGQDEVHLAEIFGLATGCEPEREVVAGVDDVPDGQQLGYRAGGQLVVPEDEWVASFPGARRVLDGIPRDDRDAVVTGHGHRDRARRVPGGRHYLDPR